MMSSNRPEDWCLTFRPLPGWSTPVAVRVRKLLKMALRSFGLRCVSLDGAAKDVQACPLAVDPGPTRPEGRPGQIDTVEVKFRIAKGIAAD